MKALEFFSGIGAFAYAAREFGIEVVRAFDQSGDANRVYEHNFGVKPSSRNLDSIADDAIPEADLWWLSPSCKPYTVRGAQRDNADPRAQSLLHLINVMERKLPSVVIVENVLAFEESAMYQRLVERLRACGYGVQVVRLCSTMFGVPMKRPRVFVVAGLSMSFSEPTAEPMAIDNFLSCDNSNGKLNVSQADLAKHSESMHIIDQSQIGNPNTYAICFTSGYDVSYRGSGSFLQYDDGRVRRFAPEEILALLGFGPEFAFPRDMPLRTAWRLAGNSVDVRCIRRLLSSLEGRGVGVKNDHDSTAHC